MVWRKLKRLINKIQYRRFCRLNGYYCPDCIYHDFVVEGGLVIFRGNKCRHPYFKTGTDERSK